MAKREGGNEPPKIEEILSAGRDPYALETVYSRRQSRPTQKITSSNGLLGGRRRRRGGTLPERQQN